MKRVWVGLVVSSLVGLSGSLAVAQEPAGQVPVNQAPVNQAPMNQAPSGNHAGHTPVDPSVQAQHLAKRLKLTADQQTQVLSILTAQRDQISGLRSDTTLSHTDRHSKVQAIRSDSEAKIRALLSDDQKQSFDQMQQKRMEKQQQQKG